MKVLVATAATQGARPSDSNDCVAGELVWMLDPCPTSRRDPDGECGCGRSFSGMSSHGSTTTALVRELGGLTRAQYEEALRATFEAHGWCSCCTARPVADVADELLGLAASWPEGAVVERRLDWLSVRALVPSGNGDAVVPPGV